ncbi:hypothetical protein BC940DRAFT_351882, partial [Gongronella butleri]
MQSMSNWSLPLERVPWSTTPPPAAAAVATSRRKNRPAGPAPRTDTQQLRHQLRRRDSWPRTAAEASGSPMALDAPPAEMITLKPFLGQHDATAAAIQRPRRGSAFLRASATAALFFPFQSGADRPRRNVKSSMSCRSPLRGLGAPSLATIAAHAPQNSASARFSLSSGRPSPVSSAALSTPPPLSFSREQAAPTIGVRRVSASFFPCTSSSGSWGRDGPGTSRKEAQIQALFFVFGFLFFPAWWYGFYRHARTRRKPNTPLLSVPAPGQSELVYCLGTLNRCFTFVSVFLIIVIVACCIWYQVGVARHWWSPL